jgi:hypothetical protein
VKEREFRTGRLTNSEVANARIKREPRKGWEFGYALFYSNA